MGVRDCSKSQNFVRYSAYALAAIIASWLPPVSSLMAADRIALPELSVVPPQGDHWIESPRMPEPKPNVYTPQHRLNFIKIVPQSSDPESRRHTVSAQVLTQRLIPEEKRIAAYNAREYMRFRMNITVETNKVTAGANPISHSADLDDTLGYYCYRYGSVLEMPNFVSDLQLYECLDPTLSFVVNLQYRQVTPVEMQPVDLSREGGNFLKSLRFAQPTRKRTRDKVSSHVGGNQ